MIFEVLWCINRDGNHRVRVTTRVMNDECTGASEGVFLFDGSLEACSAFVSTFAKMAKSDHGESVGRVIRLN